MLEHHEASFFVSRDLLCVFPFPFCFFLKETEKTKHVDAEKQANKKKHIFTIINDDDDDARLFLDLFSRLFSVRIFHANYRSAQLCETTAKISSSP
tara:strand:+ start:958 stop:1245 length:288 start_codon:yes stop_codon:yes gene_type:complete